MQMFSATPPSECSGSLRQLGNMAAQLWTRELPVVTWHAR